MSCNTARYNAMDSICVEASRRFYSLMLEMLNIDLYRDVVVIGMQDNVSYLSEDEVRKLTSCMTRCS